MKDNVNKSKISISEIKKAFIHTVPVLAGYVVLGIGYGMIMESKGFGIFWSVGMSLFLYTGTMQFVAIGLFTGGASLLTTALTSLAVGFRHFFYGISMIDRYKNVRRKFFLAFSLTDETYALVSNDNNTKAMKPAEKENYYFLVSFFNWIYWSAGTALGSVAGSVIDFNTEGIDFALTALFVSVFVEQWMTTKDHTAAITGIVISFIALIVFGPDNFLIPSMLLIVAALTVMRKKKGITDEVTANE